MVVSGAGTVVVGSALMPSSTDTTSGKERRAEREKAKVSAILHEEFPIRFWDHDLGPGRTRLLAAEITEKVISGDAPLNLTDVTGHVGRALDKKCTWDITPDGRTVVAM